MVGLLCQEKQKTALLGVKLFYILVFEFLFALSLFGGEYKTASLVFALGLVAAIMAQFPKNKFVKAFAQSLNDLF